MLMVLIGLSVEGIHYTIQLTLHMCNFHNKKSKILVKLGEKTALTNKK